MVGTKPMRRPSDLASSTHAWREETSRQTGVDIACFP